MMVKNLKTTSNQMKILLTGASGFIGSHLYEELIKLSYEVIAVSRTNKNFVICDITDLKQLETIMKNENISMNLHVKKFTSRVLGVIKDKYGLRNKSEALDQFVDLYGDKFAEREVRDEVVKEVILSCRQHIKKYGYRKMSLKELDKLTGVE